jgi:hypothetical protein
MFFLAGAAANSALDIISTLQKTLKGASGSSSAPANGQSQSFDIGANGAPASGASSVAAPTTLDPNTMNALLVVQGQGQPPLVNGDAFSTQLFSLLDGNGDGGVSQSEFEAAFGQNGNNTAADAIFAQLDANHDGSISQAELTNALSANAQNEGGQQVVGHHHHHHHGLAGLAGANAMGGSGSSNDPFSPNGSSTSNDPLSASDTSKTVTNPDGSQTTTITYADGSTVTMTMPAAAASNSSALAHNMLERMIQRQAQMIAAPSAGQGLALNA